MLLKGVLRIKSGTPKKVDLNLELLIQTTIDFGWTQNKLWRLMGSSKIFRTKEVIINKLTPNFRNYDRISLCFICFIASEVWSSENTTFSQKISIGFRLSNPTFWLTLEIPMLSQKYLHFSPFLKVLRLPNTTKRPALKFKNTSLSLLDQKIILLQLWQAHSILGTC